MGSRQAVLGRRWIAAAPTLSALPPHHWIPTHADGGPVPVLERHCACGPRTLPAQTPPIPARSRGEETVTPAGAAPAPLPHRPTLPDTHSTPLPPTVTPTIADSRLQTITIHSLHPDAQTVTLGPPYPAPQSVTQLCMGCGEPLEGKRPQAKAHGSACRQRAYRRRKKEAAQAQRQHENQRASQPEPAGLAATTVGSPPG